MNNLTIPISIMKSMIPNSISLFFLGCGTAYILETKNYTHIPLFVLFPEAYCGYNMYKHRDAAIKYIVKPT
jgi:hypothetical protein